MASSLVLRMEPILFCVCLYGLSSSYFWFGWKDWKIGMECSYNTVATVTSGPYVSATYPSHPYLLLRLPPQRPAPAGRLACPPPAPASSARLGLLLPPWPARPRPFRPPPRPAPSPSPWPWPSARPRPVAQTEPDGGNGGRTRPLDFGGRVRPGSEPNIPLRVGPNPLQPPSKHQKKGFNPSGLDPTIQPNTR